MKKFRIWFLVLIVLVGGGFGVWKYQAHRAKALLIEKETLRSLSEEQIVQLLQSQELVEPSKTFSVVQSEESRKSFLKGMREYMALAARAREEGVTEDPNVARILAYKRDGLLFQLYQNKLDNDKGSFFEVPKDQVEGYLNDPANIATFESEMKAIKEIQLKVARSTGNPLAAPVSAEGEAQAKNREAWAKAKIIAGMAKSDIDFINQPTVQLRLRVAEAGVLATNYLNLVWADKIKPTDAEIAEYLTAHPEYDVNKKRELAGQVLARAKNGEDFAALAKEFSEDRTTRSKGGVYENVEPGFLWNEVQATLLGLENGKMAENLVETKDGFHIVQLITKNLSADKNGAQIPVLTMRHILIQKRFADPFARPSNDVPPPFLTAREIAETAIRTQKREKVVSSIIADQQVSLPEDFNYPITDELRNSGVRIENKLEEIEREEKEAKKKAASKK